LDRQNRNGKTDKRIMGYSKILGKKITTTNIFILAPLLQYLFAVQHILKNQPRLNRYGVLEILVCVVGNINVKVGEKHPVKFLCGIK